MRVGDNIKMPESDAGEGVMSVNYENNNHTKLRLHHAYLGRHTLEPAFG